MFPRPQRTLAQPAEVSGFGLFSGEDVTVRFLPAPEHHGVAFQRTDLPGRPRVPALVRYVEPAARRTVLVRGSARVELVEHVLAALAGLQIDNCLVLVDAREPPNGDGSAEHFVRALVDAGVAEQHAPRRVMQVEQAQEILQAGGGITIEPDSEGRMQITYDLEYPDIVIGRQSLTVELSPTVFVRELSFARTFALESEALAMQARGLGRRATTADLLVFGEGGPVGNTLRRRDECVRHKVLDCVGDFALLGCDLVGRIHCRHSGHALNHELVRRLDAGLRERLAAAG